MIIDMPTVSMGVSGSLVSADRVSYDNTTSGLEAENVQDAVDEVKSENSSLASLLSKSIRTLEYQLPTDNESLAPDSFSIKTYNITIPEGWKLVAVSNVRAGNYGQIGWELSGFNTGGRISGLFYNHHYEAHLIGAPLAICTIAKAELVY